MPATFTIIRRVAMAGGPDFASTEELRCDAAFQVPATDLPIGVTHYEVAFRRDTLRLAVISCDRPITLRTNSQDEPSDVLPLEAKKVFTWDVLSRTPNPFRDDVESIFIDAPEGGKLTVLLGIDPAVSGPAAPGPATFEVSEEEE